MKVLPLLSSFNQEFVTTMKKLTHSPTKLLTLSVTESSLTVCLPQGQLLWVGMCTGLIGSGLVMCGLPAVKVGANSDDMEWRLEQVSFHMKIRLCY
jgi:hypothetical protein